MKYLCKVKSILFLELIVHDGTENIFIYNMKILLILWYIKMNIIVKCPKYFL
jgi:hypothetical protein